MPDGFGVEGPVEIIAHRGFSAAAPENTLAALEAAIVAGADAVEFDLRTALDGTPVLFHDDTLERTTDGTGPLSQKTFSELGGLDAGTWFAPEFAGEPIPAVEAALRLVAGPLARVYAEIKGSSDLESLERVVDAAVATDMVGRTVFIAIDWAVLDRLRSRHPDVQVGYIVDTESRTEAAIARASGDAAALLDFRAAILLDDPGLAAKVAERGIAMAAWTVDEPADAARLLEIGVPRITTNRVDDLVAWKATL